MKDYKIDFVIAWVDGNDSEWRKEKSKYSGQPYFDSREIRYRDMDILKYWFRAVENYAPWVNKVHFVTWGHLPEWLNTECEKLNIVNHKDYIPEQFLPTYNSVVIERYMHKIPDLAEHFVYFNDDFFPTNSLDYSDFFDGNGNIYNEMKDTGLRDGYYLRSTIFSTQLAALLSGKEIEEHYWMVPQHTMAPMIRSSQEYVFKQLENILIASVSKFRTSQNTHQYLFTNYLYFSDKVIERGLPFKMLFTVSTTIDEVETTFFDESIKTLCLNDWGDFEGMTYDESRDALSVIMEKKYPNKSQYEK